MDDVLIYMYVYTPMQGVPYQKRYPPRFHKVRVVILTSASGFAAGWICITVAFRFVGTL